MSSEKIQIKRVYDAPTSGDGFRVLVDRLWPRGMRKENLQYDAWPKDLTPSNALRKWYHQEKRVQRWAQFCERYREELEAHPQAVQQLLAQAQGRKMTLLTATKDEIQNHAVVLQQYLLVDMDYQE